MAALKGGSNAGSGGQVHIGKIKLIADGGTVHVAGKLDASAPKGGDGGTIETSGNTVKVADSAVVTTKAARGQNGTWLIDPDGFTIAATGGDITGATLSSQLGSNNVTIASTSGSGTGGNLTVNDKVSWLANTILTLNATNAINVNAVITGANGGLTLNAGTDINVNAPSSLQVATLNATALGNVNLNAPQTWTNNGAWTFSGTNINVNDAVNWSAGTLTLNAGFDRSTGTGGVDPGFINLNAVMTASGTARLVMTYNTDYDRSTTPIADSTGVLRDNPTASYGTPFGGIVPLLDTSPASATFGTYTGRIDFASTNTAATPLTINGNAYTLIRSFSDLNVINTPGGNGFYALASDLTASGTTLSQPLITLLSSTAVLEGLGHNIDGLTMSNTVTAAPGKHIGLIDTNLGTVRDLSLTNVNIHFISGIGGALATSNEGMMTNVAASGLVSVLFNRSQLLSPVGGLVGINSNGMLDGQLGSVPAIISGAWANVQVTTTNIQIVGGLVGENFSGLDNSQGNQVPIPAVIINSISIASVNASLSNSNFSQTPGPTKAVGTGGLVGANVGGTLSHDSSSSVITVGTTAGRMNQVGGLVGNNTFQDFGGAIFSSTATGSIVFTGGIVGTVGGLVGGNNRSSALIDNSYSSTVLDPGLGTRAAGFVASNTGSITNSTWNPTSAGRDPSKGTQNGTPPGLSTATGPSPGQGPPPSPSNAQRAANARSQAQALTQQATAQQIAVAQAAAAAAAQEAAAQAATAAQAAAAAAAARLAAATARLATIRQAASAANVISTTNLETSAVTPPNAAISSAGTQATTGIAPPKIEDNITVEDQRVRLRTAATTSRPKTGTGGRGAGFGATIRSIEINGQRYKLQNGAPQGGAPGQPGP
jgi:hypothetical protein